MNEVLWIFHTSPCIVYGLLWDWFLRYLGESGPEKRVFANAESSEALNEIEDGPGVSLRREDVADGLHQDDGEAEDRVVQVEPPAEDRHQHQEAEHLARVHEGQEVRVVVCKNQL